MNARPRSTQSRAVVAVSAVFMTLVSNLYAPVEPDCGGDHPDFPCDTCPCPAGENGSDGGGPNKDGCNTCEVPLAGIGMPVWRVSEPYMNLWVDDEPLGYQPSRGPRVSFKLSDTQRAATPGQDIETYSL